MKIKGFDVLGVQKEMFRVPRVNNGEVCLSVNEKIITGIILKGYLVCSDIRGIQNDYTILTFLEVDGDDYVCFSSSIHHKLSFESFPESISCFGKTCKTGHLITKQLAKNIFLNKIGDYFKQDSFLEHESIYIPMPCLLGMYDTVKRISYVNENLEPLELGVYYTIKNKYVSFVDK